VKKILLIIVFIYFSLRIILAQTGSVGISDARSVGLGKTYTTISRGVNTIGYNPANLILSHDKYLEFTTILPIPNIYAGVGTNFITIKDYNYFFGGVKDANGKTVGRYLTSDDKNKLLSIFENGGNFISDFSTSILTITYKADENIGAFGFGIRDFVAGETNFPKQLVDIILNGNSFGRIYDFNDASGKAWWLRNYSLSYARNLPELNQTIFKKLSVGISFKYVQGFFYAATDKIETSLQTGDFNQIKANGNVKAYTSFSDDFHVKYDFDSASVKQDASFSLFPSPAGTGFGIDFGISAQLDEVWAFGLALTDLGGLTWTKNVANYYSNTAIVLHDITDKNEIDSLKNEIKGDGKYVNEISTPLPTSFRFGVSFQLDKFIDGQFPGTMLIAFDYNQGFNNQPRNSTKPRFSIGAEWKPMDWVPFIRTGFSFGGLDYFGWAFGLGINAGLLEFNFASPDFHYFFMANQAKRISFAFDSRWKF
jgi:hypothetical protein